MSIFDIILAPSNLIGPSGLPRIATDIFRHYFPREKDEESAHVEASAPKKILGLTGLVGMVFVALYPKYILKYIEMSEGGSDATPSPKMNDASQSDRDVPLDTDEVVAESIEQPNVPRVHVGAVDFPNQAHR